MSWWAEVAGLGIPVEKLNFIYSGVTRQLSGNKIQSLLSKSVFGGLRRQKLQKVVGAAKRSILNQPLDEEAAKNIARSYLTGKPSNRKYISFIGGDKSFDISRLKISPYAHRKDLNYIIEVKGTHPFSGEKVTRHITVVTNNQLTKNEAIAIAMTNFDGEKYKLEDITSVRVTDILLGGKYRV